MAILYFELSHTGWRAQYCEKSEKLAVWREYKERRGKWSLISYTVVQDILKQNYTKPSISLDYLNILLDFRLACIGIVFPYKTSTRSECVF